MAVNIMREGGVPGGVRKVLARGAKSKAPAHAMAKKPGRKAGGMKAGMAPKMGRDMMLQAMGGM